MIRVYDALKNGYLLNKSIDLRSKTMTLDAAKDLLRHTATVSGQTISFSNDVWAMILDNEEAVDLLEAAYAKGWSSNEPDITIVANSDYNGQVYVNGAIKQLAQVGSTEVWTGSAGTVTSLEYFSGLSPSDTTFYNSTAVNIKKARFGKGVNTSGCTSCRRMFRGAGMTSNFEQIDVRHLNTSSSTNFNACFGELKNGSGTPIEIIGVGEWDVSHATTLSYFLYNTDFEFADLHKWHVPSCDLSYIFPTVDNRATKGINTKIYYTPGYWAKDPMNSANLGSNNVTPPTVYPYHDITVAGTTSFSGNLTLNYETIYTQYVANMTYDSTLGIWYYDVPSDVTIGSLNRMLFASNDSTAKENVYSISFGESIRSKLDFAPYSQDYSTYYFNLFGMFGQCMEMRTIDLTALRGIKTGNMNQMINCNASGYTSKLANVYGLDRLIGYENAIERNIRGGNYMFYGCARLRYLKLGELNCTYSVDRMLQSCTNLMRISNFPGVGSNCTSTYALTGCTALTTIDASGPISKTISFSDSPLNLASAKVILNALQTVSSETLTFSSTTKGYINADSEALSLVAAARNKGWTIAL